MAFERHGEDQTHPVQERHLRKTHVAFWQKSLEWPALRAPLLPPLLQVQHALVGLARRPYDSHRHQLAHDLGCDLLHELDGREKALVRSREVALEETTYSVAEDDFAVKRRQAGYVTAPFANRYRSTQCSLPL